MTTSGGSDTFTLGTVAGELNLTARDGGVTFTATTLGGRTTVDTDGGADVFNVGTISGELLVTSAGGNATFNADTVGGQATVTASGGENLINLRSVNGETNIDLGTQVGGAFANTIKLGTVDGILNINATGSEGDFTIEQGNGNATINSVGGPVDLTLESLNGTLDFDATGGVVTAVVHSLDGSATFDSDDGTAYDDVFELHSITGDSTFNSHAGDDVFRIYRIGGPGATTASSVSTTINAGDGNDTFCMNHVSPAGAGNQCTVPPLYPDNVGIAGTLNVHGQNGSDLYFFGLTGQYNATINAFDVSPSDLSLIHI